MNDPVTTSAVSPVEYDDDVVMESRDFQGSVVLGYGPVSLRFVAAEPDLALRIAGPRLDFVLSDRSSADAEVRCHVGDVVADGGPPTFFAGSAWEARAVGGGVQEICYRDFSARGHQPWASIRHDAALSSIDASLRSRWDGDRSFLIGFPFDEYLVSRRLASRGGVLLHASSIVTDGGAYLFVGHSGAGKSTTARHAASVGARVLSDDRTIVTAEPDGSFRAWGTPWHGSFRRATNASAPVRGLFIIIQAAEDAVAPIGVRRAIGETFVRLVHPTPNASEVELTVTTLERLVASVPCGELRQRSSPAGFELARRFVSYEDKDNNG